MSGHPRFTRDPSVQSQCLSRAIQRNVVELVDLMPFKDSEIPDLLIRKRCITEDECNAIREKTSRKEQVRKLIVIIRGRNFDTLKRFLKAIRGECSSVVEKIWSQHSIFLQETNRRTVLCSVCSVKKSVDIKYVIDYLFSKECIPGDLYELISESVEVTGQQDSLWQSVFEKCSGDNAKYLVKALEAKGHYTHIAKPLQGHLLRNAQAYSCECATMRSAPYRLRHDSDAPDGTSTSVSPASTPYVASSNESLRETQGTVGSDQHTTVASNEIESDSLPSRNEHDLTMPHYTQISQTDNSETFREHVSSVEPTKPEIVAQDGCAGACFPFLKANKSSFKKL